MRKSIILLLACCLTMSSIFSQDYIVHGTTPDLHLVHKVASKETWYSLGRTYNLPPANIAAFNQLTLEQPLAIGQSVKVPLLSTNFSQNDKKAADETFVPVYHIVAEKEWMYRISVNHNKVPIEKLEQWNRISRDEAKAGSKLIVGFLKVKEGNATAPASGPVNTASSTASGQTDVKQPAATSSTPAGSVKKDQPAPPASAKKEQPTTGAASQNNSAKSGGGYFRSQYVETGKGSSGVAGIFKSTSGWQDGKYYALMSNVVVGTIIKVTFPQTNKVIYAKVLGELPDMKESAGLALRISDAAANELGAVAGKFSVDIKY